MKEIRRSPNIYSRRGSSALSSHDPQAVTLEPYEPLVGPCWLWVPAWEEPGGYTLTGKVGEYVNIDSLDYDEDGFHYWVVEER